MASTIKDVAEYYSEKAARRDGAGPRACGYRAKSYFLQRQNCLLEEWREMAGKRILDVGCGNGKLAAPLSPANRLVGVDISKNMLEHARMSHEAIAAQAAALPFLNGTFDAALAVEVLQHIPEPAPVLSEITRVVKEDGNVLLMMIHSRSWLQRLLKVLAVSPGEYCWHTPEGIVDLMAGCGWIPTGTHFLMMPLGLKWRTHSTRHAFDFLAAAWMISFRKA